MIDADFLCGSPCRIPSVFVTSWHAGETSGAWGSGARWSIMARPTAWARGQGNVAMLAPPSTMLDELRTGRMALSAYEREHKRLLRFELPNLGPGALRTTDGVAVADGDSLFCTCPVEAAADRKCHRVWAAEELLHAGWRVWLDGTRLRRRGVIFGLSGGFSRLDRAFPSLFYLFDREFRSVEHFVGWARCVDTRPDLAEKVLAAQTAHDARSLSREVEWGLVEELRAVMLGVYTSAVQHSATAEDLLGTGDARLVAPSRYYGSLWGAESGAADAEGDNLYGEVLMRVRALLGGYD